MKLLGFVQRHKQRQARRQNQNRLNLTDVDLADMGIKRYQLETNL
jgi:uncharacterized protein YjiS (DUF1127 family)